MTDERVKWGKLAESLQEQLTETTATLRGSELHTMRCAIRNTLLRNLLQNYHALVEEKYIGIAPILEKALEENQQQKIQLTEKDQIIEWISLEAEDLRAQSIEIKTQLQEQMTDLSSLKEQQQARIYLLEQELKRSDRLLEEEQAETGDLFE